MDNLIQFISYVAITSVAAERITDIGKRVFFTVVLPDGSLQTSPNVNGVWYQLIAALFGGLICFFSPPEVPFASLDPISLSILVGLAASGGASVWSDLLSVLSGYRKAANAK